MYQFGLEEFPATADQATVQPDEDRAADLVRFRKKMKVPTQHSHLFKSCDCHKYVLDDFLNSSSGCFCPTPGRLNFHAK